MTFANEARLDIAWYMFCTGAITCAAIIFLVGLFGLASFVGKQLKQIRRTYYKTRRFHTGSWR